MRAILSELRRFNAFMVALAAIVISALVFSACDSGAPFEATESSEPFGSEATTLGKKEKVAVCHVGNELPEYDPVCTEGCGDAGKVDLLLLPENVAFSKHLGDPEHTYDGVSDYLALDEGASGEGQEDTSDDGVFVDDGCVIPDEETIFAVAYTDVDENDGGYNPDVDVLIAKVVDSNESNELDAGDLVITQSFPTSLSGNAHTGVAVEAHEVAQVLIHTDEQIWAVGTGGGRFVWFSIATQEYYEEGTAFDEDGDNQEAGFADVIARVGSDFIQASVGSPSMPNDAISSAAIDRPSDDPFIDVEIMSDQP